LFQEEGDPKGWRSHVHSSQRCQGETQDLRAVQTTNIQEGG
jgi:hypothetical protein